MSTEWLIPRILIANRGEIAVRIIRTCRDLGIGTIVAHSAADRGSLPTRMADRAICVGASQSAESYLNQEAILAAGLMTEVKAIHPGYGFLAENADFAKACVTKGLGFVGPPAEAIELMGNKMMARQSAHEAGVPIIPGSTSSVNEPAQALQVGTEIGYPLLLKASAGGGGRGLRRITSATEMAEALSTSGAEARAAFGDPTVYIEKYVTDARHIEIQVAMDRFGNAIHLGERDCSIQRRFQKMLEEAPSPVIEDRTREAMAQAALRLVQEIGYEGVGTVEYLFDPKTERFYFIEMNTRLQVEHPVTEVVTGVDLVALQIEIASGHPLPITQKDVEMRRHAIEFRINAETPERDFRPSAGRITSWVPPLGHAVRVDTHCFPGYTIPPFYDSLVAKVVVHGNTREMALARSRRVLREMEIDGIDTTLSLHRGILDASDFIDGRASTEWDVRPAAHMATD